MSADLLRRAATRLRESALAAQPGPWFADSWEIYSQTVGGPWVAETLHTEEEQQSIANADYIVAVHPPVALALADWLDRYADRFPVKPYGRLMDDAALEVARAVLREPEGGDRTCTGLCDREPEGQHERGCPHQGGTG